MLSLLRRFRPVTVDEAHGEVCDSGCRATAALDRAREGLLFR